MQACREAEMRAELAALGLLGPTSPWAPAFKSNSSTEAPWILSMVADNKNLKNKANTPEDLLQYEQMWAGR